MATTIKWPPTPTNGRVPMVKGVKATSASVLMTLSDLRQNPFNPNDASIGDVTFKSAGPAKGRIQRVLARLKRVIIVNSVQETTDDDGNVVFEVSFTDRESRSTSSVQING